MPFIYNKLVLTSSQVEFVARKLSFLFKKRLGVCCFVSALILDVIYYKFAVYPYIGLKILNFQ